MTGTSRRHKPERPSLPTGRESIVVPSLPGPPAAAEPVPEPPPPAPYPGVTGYGQVRATGRRRATGGRKREDAPGMTRESYYVTEASAAAIDAAVDHVLATLGGDVPKHVALSAILTAGAERAGEVAAKLAAQQAAELTQRLDALRQSGA